VPDESSHDTGESNARDEEDGYYGLTGGVSSLGFLLRFGRS
jgi:hypothetical protein